MKRWMMVVGAAVLAPQVMAQAIDDLSPQNVNIRIGGIYPFEDATRRVTGNMLGVGLDFNMGTGLMRNAETFFSIEWFGKSGSGAKGNMFPFMINQRLQLSATADGPRLYAYAGAGFVNIDVFTARTVPGARFGIGANLSSSLFTELGVTLSSDARGAKANSGGLWFGYRF